MAVVIQGEGYTLYKGDVLDWCESYRGPKFMALLADPPYELNFMGKGWDNAGVAFRPATWAALATHLHPGAFVMAFGGSRTYHRMACAIEDAGFVMHSALVWAFGSGFPKATNISAAIDKAAGAEREAIGAGPYANKGRRIDNNVYGQSTPSTSEVITAPATPLAATWQGHRYGRQAIKPAAEFICVAQKPYSGRPVDSITATGAGSLWIDGGRVGTGKDRANGGLRKVEQGTGASWNHASLQQLERPTGGRWPANLILSEEAARRLDAQNGERPSSGVYTVHKHNDTGTGFIGRTNVPDNHKMYADDGGTSRFFYTVSDAIDAADPLYYCAKASRGEREAGLNHLQPQDCSVGDRRPAGSMSQRIHSDEGRPDTIARNPHPCVKALDLCRYLATLLLPPAEYAPRRLLVPFAGVASEMIGGRLAGWDEVVGVERDDEDRYIEIAVARLRYWTGKQLKRNSRPVDLMPLFAEALGCLE